MSVQSAIFKKKKGKKKKKKKWKLPNKPNKPDICKLMEKIIHDAIVKHMAKNEWFTKAQHVFITTP